MTIEQLREVRERRPFQPFEIRMAGGETFTIQHPDNVAWDEEMRVATCLAGRAWVLIDVDLVTSITTRLPAGRRKARKS